MPLRRLASAARMAVKLKLLDLPEFELNRRRAAEDRDRNFQPRPRLVHFLDGSVERREWAVGHAHLLAHLERDRGLRPLDSFLHLADDALGFALRNRHRLLVGAE